MSTNANNTNFRVLGLPLIAAALILAACSKPSGTEPAADAAAESAQQAEMAAKESALAEREAELAAKEQEMETARLAAETAEAERAAANAKARAAAAAKKPSATVATPAPAPTVKPVDPDRKYAVPAGTELTVALNSDLSSKTAKAGDAFEASLVSDVILKNRLLLPAGTRVEGTITDVVSGSRAIGAVPMLGLSFNRLRLADGQKVKISGELVEQGKSEKGRDTAKILGGAAAGAVLGHQVKKNDSGKVIGGLLGGAIGAVAAKKTGTEVQLAAGSTLTIAISEQIKVYEHK